VYAFLLDFKSCSPPLVKFFFLQGYFLSITS
jgi:hypothetical protein